MIYTDFRDKKLNNNQDTNMFGKIRLRILIVVSLLFFTLMFAQLVFANNLATDGQKLAQIEQEIEKIREENVTLKVEIAKKSSFLSLSNQANDLGFEKPSQIVSF